MLSSASQPFIEHTSIVFMLFGRYISVSEIQASKLYSPIVITPSGIMMLSSEEQQPKAFLPIAFILSGNTTLLRFVQP